MLSGFATAEIQNGRDKHLRVLVRSGIAYSAAARFPAEHT